VDERDVEIGVPIDTAQLKKDNDFSCTALLSKTFLLDYHFNHQHPVL